MTNVTAQAFIDALWHLEETGDAGPIAELFAPGADVSNPLVEHAGQGSRGALQFWQAYRRAFGGIRSEFRHVVEGDGVAMLEWSSRGDAEGAGVSYGGVSVLEFGEGGVTAFRAYFDPRRLGQQLTGEDQSAS